MSDSHHGEVVRIGSKPGGSGPMSPKTSPTTSGAAVPALALGKRVLSPPKSHDDPDTRSNGSNSSAGSATAKTKPPASASATSPKLGPVKQTSSPVAANGARTKPELPSRAASPGSRMQGPITKDSSHHRSHSKDEESKAPLSRSPKTKASQTVRSVSPVPIPSASSSPLSAVTFVAPGSPSTNASSLFPPKPKVTREASKSPFTAPASPTFRPVSPPTGTKPPSPGAAAPSAQPAAVAAGKPSPNPNLPVLARLPTSQRPPLPTQYAAMVPPMPPGPAVKAAMVAPSSPMSVGEEDEDVFGISRKTRQLDGSASMSFAGDAGDASGRTVAGGAHGPQTSGDDLVRLYAAATNTAQLEQFFSLLLRLTDRQTTLQVMSRCFHPSKLDQQSAQFRHFCDLDNLQRWILPLLFKQHSPTGTADAQTETALIEIGMALVATVHFAQFIDPGITGTMSLINRAERSLSYPEATTGLERTLMWLRRSEEWEWADDVCSFARFVIFSLLHKMNAEWAAKEPVKSLVWSNIFENLHVVETFVFAMPLELPANGSGGANSHGHARTPVRRMGLHFDATGLADNSLVSETLKLLDKAERAVKQLSQAAGAAAAASSPAHAAPPPGNPGMTEALALNLRKRIGSEIEFFVQLSEYCNALKGAVEGREAGGTARDDQVLNDVRSDLVSMVAGRVYRQQPLFGVLDKREFSAVFDKDVDAVADIRRRRRGGARVAGLAMFAQQQLQKLGDHDGEATAHSPAEPEPKMELLQRGPKVLGPRPVEVTGAHRGHEAEDLSDREYEDLKQFLTKDNLIGSGSYGNVYRAVFRGEDVAVKVMHVEDSTAMHNLHLDQHANPDNGTEMSPSLAEGPPLAEQKKPVFSAAKMLAALEKEVTMHLHLRSPRLVQYIRVHRKPPDLLMVQELMARGNLRPFFDITNQDEKLDPETRLRMAVQILRGLTFLHCNEPAIAHRDIKPENVLVDEHLDVKLCDFGLSAFTDVASSRTKYAGSGPYMAPEIFAIMKKKLSGEPIEQTAEHQSSSFLLRADMYSIGVLLIELFGEKPDWSGRNFGELMELHSSGVERCLPDRLEPSELRTLIGQCLSRDAVRRPTASEALSTLTRLNSTLFPTTNLFGTIGRKNAHLRPPLVHAFDTPSASNTPTPSTSSANTSTTPPGSSSSSATSSPTATLAEPASNSAHNSTADHTTSTSERSRAPTMTIPMACENCSSGAMPSVFCPECDQYLCSACTAVVHSIGGKRAAHPVEHLLL